MTNIFAFPVLVLPDAVLRIIDLFVSLFPWKKPSHFLSLKL